MNKILLSEMTYDDYLEHYGVKGMKWGESNALDDVRNSIKTAQTEFQKAVVQRQGEIKKAKDNINRVKNAVAKDIQEEAFRRAESLQKAWNNSQLKKDVDKADSAAKKAWNNSQLKKDIDKSEAAWNKSHLKKELDKADAAHKNNVAAAKKNLDTAISDREKFKQERAAYRKEEYKKLKAGLTESPEKVVAAGAGVIAAKYGGLAIPAYNMARSQGVSKGKAVVASALGGPLANVAIAEINANSKARQKVGKR